MSGKPERDVWRKEGATSAPDELPADFLCVFNFGPDARSVKLFEEVSKARSVTLPTMAVSLSPEGAAVVRQILRRALADVAAVAAGEKFAA
jgi:hypothetical protein